MFQELYVHRQETNCFDAATGIVLTVIGRSVPLTERTIPDAASIHLTS